MSQREGDETPQPIDHVESALKLLNPPHHGRLKFVRVFGGDHPRIETCWEGSSAETQPITKHCFKALKNAGFIAGLPLPGKVSAYEFAQTERGRERWMIISTFLDADAAAQKLLEHLHGKERLIEHLSGVKIITSLPQLALTFAEEASNNSGTWVHFFLFFVPNDGLYRVNRHDGTIEKEERPQ